MEYINMSLISAILSAILGAWITNIFTWKIKNKIDALDNIYIVITKYNDAFLGYCFEGYSKESEEKFQNNVKQLIPELSMNCFIVDNSRRCGELYQIMYKWNACLHDNINENRITFFNITKDDITDEYAKEYNILLNDLLDSVLTHRRLITSFRYMLYQLIPIYKNTNITNGYTNEKNA